MLSDTPEPVSLYAEEEVAAAATITCDLETFWVEGEDVGDDIEVARAAARAAVED